MTNWDYDRINNYINNNDWYQKIELSNGLVTPGTTESKQRLRFLNTEEIKGKTVLDIGCNSGFYCLWAKKNGANRVVGIDIFEKRIKQAQTIAEIENCEIEYFMKDIFDIQDFIPFDIVFCFAVITEIPNLLDAINILKKVTKYKAYIELSIAKPVIYIPKLFFSLRGFVNIIKKRELSSGILELRQSKTGPMISPSMKVLRGLFYPDFKVYYHGRSIRYDMITIERL